MKLGTRELWRITLDGKAFVCEISVKDVKRMNLRVLSGGMLKVSVSPRVTKKEIEEFINENKKFILHAHERLEQRRLDRPFDPEDLREYRSVPILGINRTVQILQGKKNGAVINNGQVIVTLIDPKDKEMLKKAVRSMLTDYSERILPEICKKMLPLFAEYALSMPNLQFRCMVSRWGSCRPFDNTVCLNKFLICTPIECIECVIVHELAHYIRTDHSPEFHRIMSRLMPDWKKREKVLNQFGELLHIL